MKTYKKGISLIVLVITVIVLGILATTVIMSISNTNIIEETNKTVFKSDMQEFRNVYQVYIADYMLNNNGVAPTSVNAKYGDALFTTIFGDNVPEKYRAGLEIKNGKLVYSTTNETELAVLEELGMVKPVLKIGSVVNYTPTVAADASVEGVTYVGGVSEERPIEKSTTNYTPGEQTWVYMGTDDGGNILLTSQESTSFTVSLGGNELYNDISVIDSLCNTLYGNSTYGTVRNMKLTDIDKLVGYDGPKSGMSFNNIDDDYIDVSNMQNSELCSLYGYSLLDYVNESSDIYKLLCKKANKTDDQKSYWLSTTSSHLLLEEGTLHLSPECYNGMVLDCIKNRIYFTIFQYDGASYDVYSYSLRPVVVLNSNVSIVDTDGNGVWELEVE